MWNYRKKGARALARKGIKEEAARREAEAEPEASARESAGAKLRRYIAPRIRTLALPVIQASPPCNPVSCPPDRWGCGPNICGPNHPPGGP